MKIGPTLRLLREENEISQREVAKKIGVERNSLDRFEKTSKGLSSEKIMNYKKELYIYGELTDEDLLSIEQLIENIFDHLFYTNRNYNNLFIQLQALQSKLALTQYYPLLYIFDYCITVQNNTLNYQITKEKIQNKMNELTDMIQLVENTIPNNWVSLYYDYVGERYRYQYNYQAALRYYEKAEKIAYDDRHIAMINYRRAIAFTQTNQNVRALECLDKASNIFQKYMNYEKCVHAEFLKAMIYDNMRDYDKAILIYNRCLKVIKQGTYALREEQIYNNMIWSLLMKGDFEKGIQVSKIASKLELNKKAVYLYEAFAYFALNIDYKAKNALLNCKNCDEPFIDEGLNDIYKLMSNLLCGNDDKIDNVLTYLEDKQGVSGVDILFLSYTLVIQYYKRINNHEKMIAIMAKLHLLY